MKTCEIGPERIEDFIGFSWKVHSKDRTWIPPMRSSMRRELEREEDRILFLCEDNGEVVGRVAASTHPEMNQVGMVGHFESFEDNEIGASLFSSAEQWLKERGCTRILGPINGGTHRAYRLMTRGFDRDPYLLEPRNPSWYPNLFEVNGFTAAHSWKSYVFSGAALEELPDRLHVGRLARQASKKYRVERLDPAELEGSVSRIGKILDRVWEGNAGYVTPDLQELKEICAGLFSLMTSRNLCVVVDSSGKDVGYGMIYPDYANEVRNLDGDPAGWGSWLTGPLPRRVVGHTFAFIPEARKTGAPFLALDAALRVVREDGYREMVIALAFPEAVPLWERAGKADREYALYERTIPV